MTRQKPIKNDSIKFLQFFFIITIILTLISTVFNYEAFGDTDEKHSDTNVSSDTEVVENMQNIRVGLYFRDTQLYNPSSEISYFKVSSAKGIEVGYSTNNKFIGILGVDDNTGLIVRKDAFYIVENNLIKEYKQKETVADNGKILGPYHIQIGSSFGSYSEAKEKLDVYIQKGINGYIALTDSWYIWSGFYVDQKSAEEDISNNMVKKLGEEEYKIIQPSKDNIVISDEKSGNTLLVFGKKDGYLQIKPKADNNPYIFSINGKKYRGYLEVRRYESSDMTVINILPLEEYLYGVVPCEMPWTYPIEALKAQAVAARTYACKSLGKYSRLGFDVCATVYSQVYEGYSVERETTNKAVDETRGEKLYYNGEIAQVYFFSTSGGRTESAANVWKDDLPYLKSIEDKYEDPNSKYYTWEIVMTAEEIKNIMKEKGFDPGDIIGIRIVNTSEAGRVTELVVSGTIDENVFLKARCREIFNLPSQWYEILTDADVMVLNTQNDYVKNVNIGNASVITGNGVKKLKAGKEVSIAGNSNTLRKIPSIPTSYTFIGRGYGHGVGMSQQGAKGMALAGFTYDEILKYYFSGITIK